MHLAVTNANVITMDVARPRAEAIAILGGRIAVVGDNASFEGIEVPELKSSLTPSPYSCAGKQH